MCVLIVALFDILKLNIYFYIQQYLKNISINSIQNSILSKKINIKNSTNAPNFGVFSTYTLSEIQVRMYS